MLGLCLAIAPLTLSAQIFPDGTSLKALLVAKSLKCSFPWHTSTEWSKEEPELRTGKQTFEFNIDGIDAQAGKARLIGNAGADDLTVLVGDTALTFLEVVPSGSVQLTAVYGWRDKLGRFKAVHSRHTPINGPAPSQNYGFCQVW